ncbi:hypothetical protein Leryth_005778 [Lithospermum erythrorhizon]|nr:hypothetical protein Leryth_005778 [Lithospermum erythrorhizon]
MQSSSSNLIQPLKLCSHNWNTPTTKTITISRQCCRLSRRELAICSNSSLLLVFGPQVLEPLLGISRARADEETLEKSNLIDPEENSIKSETSDGNNLSLNQAEPEENKTETENLDNLNQIEQEETRSETQSLNNLNQIEQEETKTETENPGNLNEIEQKETRTETETRDNLDQTEQKETRTETKNVASQSPSKRAFIEVAIDREPIGKIVIELNNETVPVGTSRFINLVSGKAGISYRRKEFVKITPNYVQHGGVRSYGVDAELASKTGTNLAIDSLVAEWEKQNETIPGTKNVAGSVSIIVRDPSKPPPKMKLVARKGKLEIDQEEVGKDPNGTEFVISVRDSPELDESAVVIGRVVEGMEVAEKIAQVKTVKENTTSPYFRVAKLIGDKRAVVAERGFNRPYSKVQILNCGLID